MGEELSRVSGTCQQPLSSHFYSPYQVISNLLLMSVVALCVSSLESHNNLINILLLV
jgi:hypothetical protein